MFLDYFRLRKSKIHFLLFILIVTASGCIDNQRPSINIKNDFQTTSTNQDKIDEANKNFSRTKSDQSDPEVMDSDNDGLNDSREAALGTDPSDPDTDNDWLRDGWEVKNEAPNGQRLPGADPLHRNLYIDIVYTENAKELSPSAISYVKEKFSQIPVENPDGRKGISVHVEEPRRINLSVDDLKELSDSDSSKISLNLIGRFIYTNEYMGKKKGIYHQLVVVPVGSMETGGDWKIVAIPVENRRIIIHEILHTIVSLNAFDPDCDGTEHTCEGYLSLTDDEFFSNETVSWLRDNSYANSAAEIGDKTYH